ncbi:MAG: hypothetical protein QOJ91_140 [Sphingomonadales bacterium]|jgi:hypothetical protein|nr:hypothetical protein [Sphingomonadales bacterium]
MRKAFLAGLMAFGLPASPVSAQIANGASGSSTMFYLSGEQAMEEVVGFGSCYAKLHSDKALRLIATRPGSREEAETYVALFKKPYQDCLGDVTRLGATLPMVRGSIAQGLYKHNMPLPATLVQAAPARTQVRNLADASRCYVAAHREEARGLVAETKVGGRKEFDAVAKLIPDLRKCIPDGAKAQFSATLVRFRLAEALLRMPASANPAGS